MAGANSGSVGRGKSFVARTPRRESVSPRQDSPLPGATQGVVVEDVQRGRLAAAVIPIRQA